MGKKKNFFFETMKPYIFEGFGPTAGGEELRFCRRLTPATLKEGEKNACYQGEKHREKKILSGATSTTDLGEIVNRRFSGF